MFIIIAFEYCYDKSVRSEILNKYRKKKKFAGFIGLSMHELLIFTNAMYKFNSVQFK